MSDYGTDKSLGPDGYAGTFPTVSGPRLVLEAIWRRWTTDPTSLAGRRIYQAQCYDLRSLQGARLYGARMHQIGSELAQIARFDERVEDAVVLANYTDRQLKIQATLVLSGGETFTFVIPIASLTVELLTDGV